MLVLVRHGESTANAEGLLLGRTDAPLTDRGIEQAQAVGGLLGNVQRLISSPLLRATDTAAALGLGLPVEIDDRWIEVNYGEHEGQKLSAVPADVWRRWRADPGYRPAGGESLAEVADRVGLACAELLEESGERTSPEGDTVVVSHVSPIKAAVAWALGADPGLSWRLHLSTGSLTRIGWGMGGPLLHTYNQLPSD